MRSAHQHDRVSQPVKRALCVMCALCAVSRWLVRLAHARGGTAHLNTDRSHMQRPISRKTQATATSGPKYER